MGPSAQRMKKHGKRFPKRAQKKVTSVGSPIAKPRGIAPLSSVIGSIEEKKTISSGDMFKSFVPLLFLIAMFLLTQSFVKDKYLVRIQKLCNNSSIKQHEC